MKSICMIKIYNMGRNMCGPKVRNILDTSALSVRKIDREGSNTTKRNGSRTKQIFKESVPATNGGLRESLY